MKSNSPGKPKKAKGTPPVVEASSGNVFADPGLPQAGELLAKAELAHRVGMILRERKLTQVQAAEILGIDQPKVSALIRGRLDGFSVERLCRFLNALGQAIEIVVKPSVSQAGKADTRVLLVR